MRKERVYSILKTGFYVSSYKKLLIAVLRSLDGSYIIGLMRRLFYVGSVFDGRYSK